MSSITAQFPHPLAPSPKRGAEKYGTLKVLGPSPLGRGVGVRGIELM